MKKTYKIRINYDGMFDDNYLFILLNKEFGKNISVWNGKKYIPIKLSLKRLTNLSVCLIVETCRKIGPRTKEELIKICKDTHQAEENAVDLAIKYLKKEKIIIQTECGYYLLD